MRRRGALRLYASPPHQQNACRLSLRARVRRPSLLQDVHLQHPMLAAMPRGCGRCMPFEIRSWTATTHWCSAQSPVRHLSSSIVACGENLGRSGDLVMLRAASPRIVNETSPHHRSGPCLEHPGANCTSPVSLCGVPLRSSAAQTTTERCRRRAGARQVPSSIYRLITAPQARLSREK